MWYLYFLLATRLASMAGSAFIKNRKNRSLSLRGAMLSLLFPGVAILLNLARPKLPPAGTTPEEQEALNAKFSIDGKQELLERKLSRQDRLEKFRERSFAYKATHPGEWFPEVRIRNNGSDIRNLRNDIREEYAVYGMALRRAEMSGDERFLSVRMLSGADTFEGVALEGRPVFRLPFDISRQQEQEIRSLLAKQYGLDPGDDRFFIRGEHRAADRGGYGRGWSVLEFDAREKTVSAFGADFGDEVAAKVEKGYDLVGGMMQENGLLLNCDGIVEGLVTMTAVGREAVALEMDGVVLAYAVAGQDGRVRATGSGVGGADRGTLRVASALNERLKGCTDMNAWVDRALEIVGSDANLRSALERKKGGDSVRRQLEVRKAMRNSILNASKRELRKLAGGLKR